MKIIACHIDNFGKLSDVSLQFSDGLNVLNHANGWGKSTLAAFLKAMFYGLDAKKATNAFEKERVMYRPWQGGAFGGEVDFEINGKQYRISRTFGRTEKTDEFHLYDLKTNLECTDYSEAIGNEIFELDSNSFRRSIYIAQNDCASEASDGINAKLGNLVENTDDINNFESANQHLKEILNQLTPERVTGSIKKRKNYITQLAQELRTFESAKEGIAGLAQKEQQVAKEIQELHRVRKEYAQCLTDASEDSRKQALYAQYDAICKDVEEKTQKRDEYKKLFPAGVPTEEEFQTQMKYVSNMKEAHTASRGYELNTEEVEEYTKLQKMFEHSVPSEKDIDALLEMFHEIDKQKAEIARQESKLAVYNAEFEKEPQEPKIPGSKAYLVFLIFGILCAFFGLCISLVWYFKWMPTIEQDLILMAAFAMAAGGIVFGVIGGIMGARVGKEKETWQSMMDAMHETQENKIKALQNTIAEMQQDIRKVYATIGKFLGSFHINCETSEYQSRLYALKAQAPEYLRLKGKEGKGANYTGLYKEFRSKLEHFERTYQLDLGEDVAYNLNLFQTKATEYQMAELAYQEAKEKKESFETKQEKSFWTKQAACPYSLEELNTWIAKIDEELENLKAAKSQYTKQLENLQEQLDIYDEKEQELKEMQLAQEKDIHKYNLLKVTQNFLQQAKEQFTSRYMEPIADAFGKYYSILTGETERKWMIDANIDIRIKEQGELRETHWFSAGYRDLIGICMRMALVDAMYKEEKPFLILDDPFVNLDQDKVAAGNKLLSQIAKEYQVIYFTCHDSRTPSEV